MNYFYNLKFGALFGVIPTIIIGVIIYQINEIFFKDNDYFLIIELFFFGFLMLRHCSKKIAFKNTRTTFRLRFDSGFFLIVSTFSTATLSVILGAFFYVVGKVFIECDIIDLFKVLILPPFWAIFLYPTLIRWKKENPKELELCAIHLLSIMGYFVYTEAERVFDERIKIIRNREKEKIMLKEAKKLGNEHLKEIYVKQNGL